jgi:hypothetical protein
MANQEFKDWKDRIEVSHRKHRVMEKLRERWIDYYRGKQWDEIRGKGYNDLTVENMVFSNIRTIMPSVNLNNPKIFCKPTKRPYIGNGGTIFDTISASAIFEVLMNHYYRTLHVKRSVDKSLMDALIGPWGFVQLGYTLETEKVQADGEIEVNELIKSESVFVVRRSPNDLRFDTNATDSHLNDARWIALRWVKPLEDVKANPKYKNTRGLKSNMRAQTDNFGNEDNENGYKPLDGDSYGGEDIWGMVEGWDIWDKKTHKLFTYVYGHDKFLYKGDWPINIDGFPIEIIYFNENPDEVYPISDVEIYIDAQDELNRLHSLQLDHTKRISQRRYAVKENTIDSEELELLKTGGDGTIITVRGDTQTSLTPIKDATISQDIYAIQNVLKNSIREAAGLSAFEKGISQKYDTAAEPTLISQGIGALKAERLNTVEDFIKRIVQKMAVIVSQTMDSHSVPLNEEQFTEMQKYGQDKLGRIVGEDGKQIIYPWITVGRDALYGEYDFDIEVGSTQPVNDAARRQDAATLYNMLGTNPYLKQREGTKFVMEAFGVVDADKFLKTEEEVQQAEQAGMMASIEAQKAVDSPKRETDIAKTTMKSQVSLSNHAQAAQVERDRIAAEYAASMEKTNVEREKAGVNLLQSALRPRTGGQ